MHYDRTISYLCAALCSVVFVVLTRSTAAVGTGPVFFRGQACVRLAKKRRVCVHSARARGWL